MAAGHDDMHVMMTVPAAITVVPRGMTLSDTAAAAATRGHARIGVGCQQPGTLERLDHIDEAEAPISP